jgi:hypothetical protein
MYAVWGLHELILRQSRFKIYLFIRDLFCNAANSSGYTVSNDCMINR